MRHFAIDYFLNQLKIEEPPTNLLSLQSLVNVK